MDAPNKPQLTKKEKWTEEVDRAEKRLRKGDPQSAVAAYESPGKRAVAASPTAKGSASAGAAAGVGAHDI